MKCFYGARCHVHDGSTSLAEPVEILLTPVTFPVSVDRLASHRFHISAALFSIAKMTLLEADNQQPGVGTAAAGKDDDATRPCPARSNPSYKPVFIG